MANAYQKKNKLSGEIGRKLGGLGRHILAVQYCQMFCEFVLTN